MNAGYAVFFYAAPNSDYFSMGEVTPGHTMAAGASASGQSVVAYNSSAGDIIGWKAGEWHHIAATFSASANHIKFYLDGVQIADTSRYVPPSASGGSFDIGSAVFTIDELRISKVAMPDSAIAYDAAHTGPFPENEVLLPLVGATPGELNYSVAGCGTATYSFTGIPISNLDPPGGLLRAGSTSFAVSFNTLQATTCRYSVGIIQDYASMQVLDTGPSTAIHSATIQGVSSDPRVINRVYFRCASNPDYLLSGTYRTLAPPGQPFPRIGNIWLGGYLLNNAPDTARKTELFVGANSSDPSAPGRVAQLRNTNPSVLNIPAMIPVGTQPDDYSLKDVHGNKIANWCVPEIYVPNQTKPEVAEFFARTAYQQLASTNFLADGIFFDQFNTTIQQPFTDCHGNKVQIDADGDGIADDRAALNAAWKAGMYAMVNSFRRLAPNAYAMAHIVQTPAAPEDLAAFNGIALEFFPQSVRQGQMPFGALWDLYQAWESRSVSPAINLVQACPPDQLSYGYGYDPTKGMLPSTIAFAQSSYANMRFGLGLTLMGNGFFGFDFGDAPVPVTWWYDEYDFNLGYPIGPAVQIGAQTTLYRRDFTNGAVLLNGSASPQTVTLEPGLKRLSGAQAPLHQYMVDDADSEFSASGSWRTAVYDTGTQYGNGTGPFYHCWKASCHQSDAGTGQAQWKLKIPADGQYTVQVWLPAAPGAATWTKNAIYEVMAGENVLASATIDQTSASAGDALHQVATLNLKAGDAPFLRVRNGGSGALIADAVYVTSTARYNDGSPVQQVTVGAFDSILLQLADPPGCSYSLSHFGQAFAAQGGTGTITINTGAGCTWTVGTLPAGVILTSAGSGVGNGSVTFQVLPNAGGGVSTSFTIARQTFTIERSASSIPGLAAGGSLGQVASQGTWDFTLDAINLGSSATTARFTFADNSGNPLALPLTFPQSLPAPGPLLAATLDRTLNPNAQIVMESTGPDSAATLIGSGQLLSNGNVSGFGIFSNPKLKWNAVVPLETRNASKYILAFDNTSPLTTGVAVASLAAQAQNVPIIIRDDTGTQIGNPTISLSALGHTSFMLNDPTLGFPVTNNRRGTIEFDTPAGGQISVLGLRANGAALTTLPVLANVGTAGGSITHVAYNGGWTSVFYMVNTGNASAQFTLSFFDENGIALPVPLLLPQSGMTVSTAALTQTLAPGAMLVVNTQTQDAQTLVIGSAQLATTGNISGFEIFRWTTFGQEASVPLETRAPNGFALVFDDTKGLTTGVALANLNAAAATVTARIYDDTGTLLQTVSINLGSRGHTSFMLPDSYAVTASKRGMVEFVVPPGAKISAIGLRAKNDGTLTTIPVLAK